MKHSESSYDKLVDLIMHTDTLINLNNRNHFMAMAALIPIMGFLVKIERFNGWVLLSIAILTILLALHWLNMETRLHLQKKCWVELARKIESGIFNESYQDIYLYQENYFKNLAAKDITFIDRLLQKGNPQRVQQYSIALLASIFVFTILTLSDWNRDFSFLIFSA